MNYEFPYIEHISQVAPLVKDNPAFVIADKGEYTVINYLLASPEVFPDVVTKEDAILRECRGIAFDSVSGNIISRPFHKFFNYGEREETRNIDLSKSFVIGDKLDGSMIRPLFLKSGMRLGTRMGITDVAMQAEKFIADKPNYLEYMRLCHFARYTPMFEWCSRKQRIVLDYPEDSLVLLAVRETEFGNYQDETQMKEEAMALGIPVVEYSLSKPGIPLIHEATKAEENKEGYVVVFDDGHRMKIKTDWYVLLHKTKELVSTEKNLLKTILTNTLDDIKPTLPDHDLKSVEVYEKAVAKGIEETEIVLSSIYTGLYDTYNFETKKSFAITISNLGKYKPFLFKMWDGEYPREMIIRELLKACSSGTKLNEARWLMNNVKYTQGDSNNEN